LVAVAEIGWVQTLLLSQSLDEIIVSLSFLMHAAKVDLVHLCFLLIVELLAEHLLLHRKLLVSLEHGFVQHLLVHLHAL